MEHINKDSMDSTGDDDTLHGSLDEPHSVDQQQASVQLYSASHAIDQSSQADGSTEEVKPGEYVLRELFQEFTQMAEKKIDHVLASEALEKPLAKSLQRGEDIVFDQLLTAFGTVAENCLPSLLRTLFAWYERQLCATAELIERHSLKIGASDSQSKATGKNVIENTEREEQLLLLEKRDLAVEFIFCLVLIEVLKQLPLHPGHEDLTTYIENLAFKHFKFRESAQKDPNIQNINMIADLYAEVIGVMVYARFHSVRKRFTIELNELRGREGEPIVTHNIISLLMGMKFFRIKMVPIEEFEASFLFLHDCASYFLEVKDKDIKHALAGLFVEILVPVAAVVKNEVNVPCLKNFVEMLYPRTLDLCTKKKHTLALFPLVTCLLCVSQKSFFLQNWHYFLTMCLAHLKHRDPKMSRCALESLYRLLWVYMIRIKCESNSATQSRLQSIVNSLFPKGSKAVVPRDTPLNIFVKIIQFIAQERLDFAMKDIVFDLLSVGRPIKIILAPERMNIAMRAFLVVTDGLQQKEGEPPMPRTVGPMPSGNTIRVKKTYLNKMLTEEVARTIGVNQYYSYVRKALNDILRALDVVDGRPLMMTNVQNINKAADDMITGERKPKIDLFRTCVAAIPRLIPDGMSRGDLVDLLSRLTVHMDEEMRGLACQSLQNLVNDFPTDGWREDVVDGFMHFIMQEVNDTFPHLLDNALRLLLHIMTNWRQGVAPVANAKRTSKTLTVLEAVQPKQDQTSLVLHRVEGFALVMLCNCRQPARRLAAHILKEARYLLKILAKAKSDDPVADVIDRICPSVVEECLDLIPANERTTITAASFNVDLQWLADRSGSSWVWVESEVGSMDMGNYEEPRPNAWLACMMGFMSEVERACPTATSLAWTIVCQRLNALYSQLDITPINDNRASVLLRGASSTVRKSPNDKDVYLHQWRSYLMFTCKIAPTSYYLPHYRGYAFDASSSPDSTAGSERSFDSRSPQTRGPSPSEVFKQILPLIRSEQPELRGSAVLGLSFVNGLAIKDLMEELVPYIREAIDRKQENMRRRRRRELLRLQLGRLMELIAEKKTFGSNQSIIDRDAGSLNNTFVEYIDGVRLSLEADIDKDIGSPGHDIKLNFCNFVTKLIKSFKLEGRPNLMSRELRRNLFYLFAHWTGKFSSCIIGNKRQLQLSEDYAVTTFEFAALQAMATVLCCGAAFDQHCLSEDSCIYYWIECLVASKDERLNELGQETIVYLLENNADTGSLLDWLVDCCYTKPVKMADICFTSLATIFCLREYPCDHYVSIIIVTLMHVGSPKASIHQQALQLLQVLDYRFFDTKTNSVLTLHNDDTDSEEECESKTCDFSESSSEGRHQTIQLRNKPQSTVKPFEPLMINMMPCNQLQLSRRMAQLHPQLTMPIISEVTFRMQTARSAVCKRLLECLVPWLWNIELVMDHVPGQSNPISASFNPLSANSASEELQREGWGSSEATEMLLNNLLYITVKFSDLYLTEIEDLWAALSSCWPNNLRIIIRYLFIITGIAPNELLPYTKRVALFMARSKPDRFIDEIMAELQSVESLNCLIERTETPPFYRITSIRKGSGHSDDDCTAVVTAITESGQSVINVEQGTLHTKRHSTESGTNQNEKHNDGGLSHSVSTMTCSNTFVQRDNRATSMHEDLGRPFSVASANEDSANMHSTLSSIPHFTVLDTVKPSTPQPHPLPMPEFGGYYAPLTEFLPASDQPIFCFHRCYLALMLLCDVLLHGVGLFDWTPHIPTMLHVSFLGLDHSRPIVNEHSKQLLLHLLVLCARHKDDITVGRVQLQNKIKHLGYGLNGLQLPGQTPNFTEPPNFTRTLPSHSNSCSRQSSLGRDRNILPLLFACREERKSESQADDDSSTEVNSQSTAMTTEMLVKYLIDFLSSKQGSTLWQAEDITAKIWTIRSAEQIAYFLEHILHVFADAFPNGHIEERWAEVSLQLALSCSSRHYAGRSLQIFRALKMPINSRMLSDILSRLVETVAEQGEDMQGYVTELMLTLEAAVDSLDSEQRAISKFIRDLFKSTPNLDAIGTRKSAPVSFNQTPPEFNGPNSLPNNSFLSGHNRSTSYTAAIVRNGANGTVVVHRNEAGDSVRNRSSTECNMKNSFGQSANFGRSRSVQSLKMLEAQMLTPEDRTSLLAQLFWISMAMLDSDYEHEFLLAIRLLEKTLGKFSLEKNESQEKAEKILLHSKWANFPGLHALLLKGCTSAATYEPTIILLHKITPVLEVPIVDPSESAISFPYTVIALLPYMLANYDEPNQLCIRAADSFASWCSEKAQKLDNLATVMTLYSRRQFSKESFQWTKCVVKYLYDAYDPHVFVDITAFLIEIMDKGPSYLAPHTLSILNCILHYMDINSTSSTVNQGLNKIISKCIEGSQWKDALKIIKLIVSRSSSLAAPPMPFNVISPTLSTSCYGSMSSSTFTGPLVADSISIASGASSVSFSEGDFGSHKRELPGRTMEFTFDLTQTPIIGRRYLNKVPEVSIVPADGDLGLHGVVDVRTRAEEKQQETCSPRRSLSYNHGYENNSNWKKPWLSQSRTRERLVSLLTTFGQRVGLPKSPSVIFSQSSDVLDRQSSVDDGSTEDISVTNNDASADSKLEDTAHGEFGLFKDFDFLEYELESQEGESMDNFNWGVRRRSLCNLDTPEGLNPYSPNHGINREQIKEGDNSSDEEAGSVSPMYESMSGQNENNETDSTQATETHRPASVLSCSSSHSLVSDNDL